MQPACIRHTDLPGTSRLFADFAYQFDSVAQFYQHDPYDPGSFERAAAQIQYPEERRAATVLHRALDAARAAIERGERDAPRLIAAMREIIRSEPLAQPDYVELVDAETLEPVTRLRRSCLALLAARFGATRLIDNLLIEEVDAGFRTTL